MLPMIMPRLSIEYDADLHDYAILDNEEGRFVAAARTQVDANLLLQTLAPYYPSPSPRLWVLPILDPADFDVDLMAGANVDAADKLARLDTAAFRQLAVEMVGLSGEDAQTEEAITLWLRQFMAQYSLSEQVA